MCNVLITAGYKKCVPFIPDLRIGICIGVTISIAVDSSISMVRDWQPRRPLWSATNKKSNFLQ